MPATPAFPPPWVAEENERRDANGQALTYVYFEGEIDRHSLPDSADGARAQLAA